MEACCANVKEKGFELCLKFERKIKKKGML